MPLLTKHHLATACLSLVVVLLLTADLSTREAKAKGPKPKPDFVIQTEQDDLNQAFVTTRRRWKQGVQVRVQGLDAERLVASLDP